MCTSNCSARSSRNSGFKLSTDIQERSIFLRFTESRLMVQSGTCEQVWSMLHSPKLAYATKLNFPCQAKGTFSTYDFMYLTCWLCSVIDLISTSFVLAIAPHSLCYRDERLYRTSSLPSSNQHLIKYLNGWWWQHVNKGSKYKVGKTGFVEERSFFNIFRSFDRLWIGYILVLQVSTKRLVHSSANDCYLVKMNATSYADR